MTHGYWIIYHNPVEVLHNMQAGSTFRINVINLINKLKSRKYMIIPVDAEKASGKLQ